VTVHDPDPEEQLTDSLAVIPLTVARPALANAAASEPPVVALGLDPPEPELPAPDPLEPFPDPEPEPPEPDADPAAPDPLPMEGASPVPKSDTVVGDEAVFDATSRFAERSPASAGTKVTDI